jgi:DNA-binding CsgD family transcriptional regulator
VIATLQEQIDAHLVVLLDLYGQVNRVRPTGERLSPRELEVATLYAASPLTAAEVGRQLFMSPDTVKSHMRKIFRKLGVTRRMQLSAALAQENARVPR